MAIGELLTFEAAEEKFRHLLAARHMHYTHQRQAMFRHFWQADGPVSFWDLEHHAGCGSVWSTMKVLLECGLAREIEPEPPARCQYCGTPSPRVCGDSGRNYGYRWQCQGCWSGGRLPRTFILVDEAFFVAAEAA